MNTASLNQIATNIRNLLRGGRGNNEDLLSLDQIKFMVKYYRALFLRRDAQINGIETNLAEQELGLITFESVDTAESEAVSSARIVRRSTVKIPTPVRFKYQLGLTFVGYQDKFGAPIPTKLKEHVYWNAYSKYTSTFPFSFYHNGYIYIENDATVQNVQVRGLFFDPEEVFNFRESTGLQVYDENTPFPISEDMIEAITKSIVSGELSRINTSDNDNKGDKSQGGSQ